MEGPREVNSLQTHVSGRNYMDGLFLEFHVVQLGKRFSCEGTIKALLPCY